MTRHVPTWILAPCLALHFGCTGQLSWVAAPGSSPEEAVTGGPATPGTPVVGPDGTPPDGTPPDGMPPDGGPVTPTSCVDPPEVAPAASRRLTNEEFAFAIQDVFDVDPRALLDEGAPDFRVGGFTNNAGALTVDSRKMLVYLNASHDIVDRANWGRVLREHASCQEMTEACQDGYTQSLGTELWRRALTQDELTAMRRLFTGAENFEAGSQSVAKALMVSPAFLYRLEGEDAVSDEELGVRLALMLWNSAPDESVMEAVEAGDLDDPVRFEALVDQMLEDPRAHRSLERFVRDWLMLDDLKLLPLEDPIVDDAFIEAMQEETIALFDKLVWEDDASLMSAVGADWTVVQDRRLAELYGVEGGTGMLDLSGTTRRGLMGHASVLSLTGTKEHEILIYRGLFVMNNLFCTAVPEPTAELLGQADELLTDDMSSRERSDVRLTNGSCGGCHTSFEPLGFAMDIYDPIGRERMQDKDGFPVASHGFYPGSDGETFEDLTGFADMVHDDPRFSSCMTTRAMQFAWGRPLTERDQCAQEEVLEQFRANGMTWKVLLKAIVMHPSFRTNAELTPEEEQ